MNPTPDADTRSPWYEAFAAVAARPEPRWLPGTQFPSPEAAPANPARPAEAEERWATEALFDCYNG
jgi:hypothetical protein